MAILEILVLLLVLTMPTATTMLIVVAITTMIAFIILVAQYLNNSGVQSFFAKKDIYIYKLKHLN
jgi:hypothetical protein